jgi:hypothetical protein
MANIRKQFNFRNGVQVDDDNLVVSPTGLVGIGTTIPTEILDVRGTAKVVGLVTANQIFTPDLTATTVSITSLSLGDSIVGGGVSIRSGIITASGSGVVTYYGDGGRLSNLPTSQWLDVDVGLGFTSIYSQGFVGISTNDPRYPFQVGGTNNISAFVDGVGINSNGNIVATGIVTGGKFVGIGSDLTQLNASNIAYGTISNDRIPVLLNSKMPSDIQVSGAITATSFVGSFIGNIIGIVTGNVIGNVTGIASTARTLIGNPDITVNNVTATSIAVTSITNVTSIGATNINLTGVGTLPLLHVGTGGTAVTLTSNGRIGIGSVTPTDAIQILKDENASIQVISPESKLVLGQQKPGVSIASSAGVIRYGNSQNNFDLLNYAPGNFGFYLHSGNGIIGVDTGRFDWIYGQTSIELMSLTYNGRLGIGKTNPDNTLHVVGTSTVTGNAWFGGDVTVAGTLNVGSIQLPSIITNSNIFTLSGVSTFNDITVQNIAEFSSIGIGTTNPIANIDAQTSTALFSQLGLGTISPRVTLDVNGQALISSVGIGTTTTNGNGLVISDDAVILSNSLIEGNLVSIILDSQSDIGIGTTNPRSAVDFSDAGKNILSGEFSFMLPPRITTAERVGLATVAGAFIFNTSISKFQGYTGIAWTDFH